jgi:hypothetical protein
MFCPKCGAQNIEDAQFCRGCGENISLVPQALSGHLPERRAVGHDAEGHPYDEAGRRIERKSNPPRLDKAIKSAFVGLAFLTIAIIMGLSSNTRRDWWYWLLIPAFAMIGGGVAEYIRLRHASGTKKQLEPENQTRAVPPARISALPPRNTAELVQPPSITENTTRHLDMKREAPEERIGKSAEN